MDTRRTTVVWGLLILGLVAASEAGEPLPVQTDNSNALVLKHHKELELAASTEWVGWPMAYAVDGKVETSWFSAQDDSAAKGKRPWIGMTFPEDVTVKRVTVLGNRDPQWPVGYSILAGRIELIDKDGKVVHKMENDGLGNGKDFDLKLEKPLAGVRFVRFTSLGDEGDKTPHGDIAVSEVQVE